MKKPTRPAGGPPRRKRAAKMRPLAATLDAATAGVFRRRGFSESSLAKDWASIVGPDMAARCLPRGLKFPRQGERRDGSLTLRVAPGFAIQLQHLTPLLIERINAYFGYRAIDRLVLNQGPLPKRPTAHKKPMVSDAPLDAAMVKRLATVDDEDLRRALERLGRSFHGRRET